jgi:hypothetical protein
MCKLKPLLSKWLEVRIFFFKLKTTISEQVKFDRLLAWDKNTI